MAIAKVSQFAAHDDVFKFPASLATMVRGGIYAVDYVSYKYLWLSFHFNPRVSVIILIHSDSKFNLYPFLSLGTLMCDFSLVPPKRNSNVLRFLSFQVWTENIIQIWPFQWQLSAYSLSLSLYNSSLFPINFEMKENAINAIFIVAKPLGTYFCCPCHIALVIISVYGRLYNFTANNLWC